MTRFEKGWIIGCAIVMLSAGVWDLILQIVNGFSGFPLFALFFLFLIALPLLYSLYHTRKGASIIVLLLIIFPIGFFVSLTSPGMRTAFCAAGFAGTLGTVLINSIPVKSSSKNTYAPAKKTEFMPVAEYAKLILYWSLDPHVADALFRNSPQLDRHGYEMPVRLLQMFSVDLYAQSKDFLAYVVVYGLLVKSLEPGVQEQYDAFVSRIPKNEAIANGTQKTDAFAQTVGKVFVDYCSSLGLCRIDDTEVKVKGTAFYQTVISACSEVFDHVVITE